MNRNKAITGATELIADENPGLIQVCSCVALCAGLQATWCALHLSCDVVQDTCLLIACHNSCLTKDMKRTFTNTIRTAMKIFPPNAVFVCDNGPWDNPRDRTIEVCDLLSLEVDATGTEKCVPIASHHAVLSCLGLFACYPPPPPAVLAPR